MAGALELREEPKGPKFIELSPISPEKAEEAISAAFDRMEEIVEVASIFDEESERENNMCLSLHVVKMKKIPLLMVQIIQDLYYIL